MAETEYFVVRKKALPKVLLNVVEAKSLLETRKVLTVQEAVDEIGISRSSFYKYKDDVFQFHDNAQGTTITITFLIDDEPGILSDVLKIIADHGANILTIHQSIPINATASLTLSIQILETTQDVDTMLRTIKDKRGVHDVQLIARE
ncbi:MAG: ACT domain-containing protein [Lachnospiraceae bacterium]|nr:ACT domain-containing protein [Lachnospiraceae bacterium]